MGNEENEKLIMDEHLLDPLREPTRRTRRMLLFVSTLAFGMTFFDITPTEITTLGVKLESDQIAYIPVALQLFIVYYIFAFLFDTYTDHALWRARYAGDPAHGQIIGKLSKPEIKIRIWVLSSWDYFLPVLFAIVVVYKLSSWEPCITIEASKPCP